MENGKPLIPPLHMVFQKIPLSYELLTLYSIDIHQRQTAFENIEGKEEIAPNELFLFFPKCFLLNQIIASPFVHIFDTLSLFGRAQNWHVR